MALDTNFDDLATHFKQRIYGSRKGAIRLAVLWRDLLQNLPLEQEKPLRILDIGAGLAQLDLKLADLGHQVCINDLSAKMLALAKEQAEGKSFAKQLTWQHGAFQDLEPCHDYDVVMAHAVLEWLAEPETLIAKLGDFLQQNGVVSLMFYNFDALLFHNLLRGNFNKIQNNDFAGMQGGLTPPKPLKLAWVEQTLQQHGFEVFYQSGIRVFSDYVGVRRGGNDDDAAVLDMELQYSNQQPYVQMGRYVHYMCKRK
ncbi:MAG: methyltransferase domain-containing protein [Mariprofundaceae bacterium]|nr:methyltransferase domain-containing protein [Mariprofundaceae bacterium]